MVEIHNFRCIEVWWRAKTALYAAGEKKNNVEQCQWQFVIVLHCYSIENVFAPRKNHFKLN